MQNAALVLITVHLLVSPNSSMNHNAMKLYNARLVINEFVPNVVLKNVFVTPENSGTHFIM